MALDSIEKRLEAWGDWLAHRAAGGHLGYPSESTEHRIRRMAPEPDAVSLSVWYCNGCNHRLARFKQPGRCPECHGSQFRTSSSVCHGTESPKTKRKPEYTLPDDDQAQEMDRMVAELPKKVMRDALRMVYMGKLSERLAAKMMNIPKTRFSAMVKHAKYWLDGRTRA